MDHRFGRIIMILCIHVAARLQVTGKKDRSFLYTPDKLWLPSFTAGTRSKLTDTDLFYKVPFWECVSFCARRPACTAVSYSAGAKFCWLSLKEPVTEESKGFIFSAKTSWDEASYQWCTDQCKTDRRCNSKDGNCGKRDCKVPEDPTNGAVLGNLRDRNNWIAYMCDRGFVLTGEARSMCNNKWNSTVPVCKEETE